jgi:hypothetical protein
MYQGRDIRHFPQAGISLGIDVKNGKATLTLCATNIDKGDTFSRPAARHLINLRFDADDSVLKSLGLSRQTTDMPYSGDKPRTDILAPLVALIKEELDIRNDKYIKKVTMYSRHKQLRDNFQNTVKNAWCKIYMYAKKARNDGKSASVVST